MGDAYSFAARAVNCDKPRVTMGRGSARLRRWRAPRGLRWTQAGSAGRGGQRAHPGPVRERIQSEESDEQRQCRSRRRSTLEGTSRACAPRRRDAERVPPRACDDSASRLEREGWMYLRCSFSWKTSSEAWIPRMLSLRSPRRSASTPLSCSTACGEAMRGAG